ncbi:putative reverse transcriptase domain-containing protein [Tanacetum coccineum]|uniref:Reverse transcriptase domain-containing protein n=1 Tax=Tanacetum coccineum TaxID=301880 RepID=A0ABQ5F7S0_9ASTR
MKCPQHYLTEMQEVILFYNGLDILTRQILDSRGVIPTKTAEDAKKAIQEMAEYSQKWHNGTSRERSTETSDRLAVIQATLNNLGREIKKVNEKVYATQDGLGELAHTRLTVELADRTVKYPKGIAENVLVGIGKFTFLVDFIILDMPEDIKVPLILERPFLSTACAKIDVYKRKITLRVGEEKIIFKSVKPASSIIKRVYMLSLRERMELDLEAKLMGETLVLNRSLDPFLEDYIKLNDLNEPFELRRNQGDDLMPTIEEGEVIEEFRTRDEDLDIGIDDYPSYCDDDKKIHIDWDNVVEALMNVPIFVGTFSIMTDFAILEDMDAYRDE